MYDWSNDRISDYLTKNSESKIVYIEYTYQQLGKDEVWFKEICRLLLNDPLKIKREVFLQRLRGSTESPYDPDDLAQIQEHQGKVKEEIFINEYFKLDVYEPLDKRIPYLVGVDVSDGYGKDNSATTVLNPYTLKPVAEFKSPYISSPQYAQFLFTLVRKHMPRAVLCIEKNRGESIISQLMGTSISPNIYYDTSKEFIQIDERLDPQGFLRQQAETRRIRGIWTGEKSREIMFGLLDAHIKEHKDKFVVANLIGDILCLIRNKSGKIVAGSGFHDDSLMSYLMALYVYYHGNNLHRFGVIKGGIPEHDKQNQGLTYEETLEQLPADLRQHFNVAIRDQSDYDKRLMEEMNRCRAEARKIDNLLNPINRVENCDEDDEYGEGNMDLSLFDELNDF